MKKLCAHLMAVLFVSCGFAFGQDLNDGLVAYYPFNGNANDESGNGRNGEMLDGGVFTVDRHEVSDTALSLADNDYRIRLDALADFAPTTSQATQPRYPGYIYAYQLTAIRIKTKAKPANIIAQQMRLIFLVDLAAQEQHL
jgi:hypothetical protein